MKVLIADTIHESLQFKLTQVGFDCTNAADKSAAEIKSILPAFDGIVLRSKMRIDADLLAENPQLKFIGRVGAGLEHIDVKSAESLGVKVISSPEGNRQAVAEHALGMLLSILNNIHSADREVRDGQWIRKANEGAELRGKKIGIIGYGNTGSAFAQVVSGFGSPILAYDQFKSGFGNSVVREASMQELFDEADVISLHIPFNTETHYLVDKAWLTSFKKPIYLINTSRGSIVDTAALLDSIKSGRVLGACLDVLEFETETLNMPDLDVLPASAKELMRESRVLLTPHIAGLTEESYEKLSSILADKIIDSFKSA